MPKRHLLAAAIAQLLITQSAQAAVIVVDSTADEQTNGNGCTLREAIINANADDQSGSTDCVAGSGGDEIQLPAGQTITLTSQLPTIQSDVTISGGGARIQRDSLACTLDNLPTADEFRLMTVAAPAGVFAISNLVMANGCADSSGGAILISDIPSTITGMTFEGNQAQRGGAISFSGETSSSTVSQSSFVNNTAALFGGGAIYNTYTILQLDDSTFTGNSAAQLGGAIEQRGGPAANIQRSTFSGNQAATGGAIARNNGAMAISASTLAGNTASGGGGGVYMNAPYGSPKTATITNSTISGNSSAQGGGIYLKDAGSLELGDSTLADNVGGSGSQIYWTEGSTVNVTGSVLSGAYPACSTVSTYPSGSYNLTTDTSCAVVGASVVAASLLNLGPLQDNGGPTETRALGPGSAAINAGGSGCAATDQRGESRPVGVACDVGAFELQQVVQSGTVLVVNALGDAGDGFCGPAIGDCTLRDAVLVANSNIDASEITFDGSVFDGTKTITLLSELDKLLPPITITGLGDTVNRNGSCNLDGVLDAGEFRLMRIDYSDFPASISNLTLANGCADGDSSQRNGGAILAASQGLTLTDMHFEGNRAYGRGGALRIASEGSTATITGGSFVGNTAGAGGGAVSITSANVTFSSAQLTDNRAYDGGAIHLGNQHTLTINDSSLVGNSAAHYGGAVFTPPNSTLDVDSSTFTGNSAALPGGAIDAGPGAGSAMTTITRSVLNNNFSGDVGGAIRNNGNLLIDSSTISGNDATESGGGIFAEGGMLTLRDSTLAHNTASTDGRQFHAHNIPVYAYRNLFAGGPSNCFSNAVLDGAGNVGDDLDNCGPGTTSANIFLQPLADNGGPTLTRGLGAGSAAIDGAGNGCAATDQRGVARPVGAACDAGAFEVDEAGQVGTSLVVNALGDAGDGICGPASGECTLRDAVLTANADPDDSTVTFDPGVFANTVTIQLAGGQMAITQPATITGPGRDLLTVDANAASRHFWIDDGSTASLINTRITDITLAGGEAGNPGGGAVLSYENLDLSNVTLQGNTITTGSGGALRVLAASGDTQPRTLVMDSVTIAQNSAQFSAGGFDINVPDGSSLDAGNLLISGNAGSSSGGGGDIHLNDGVVNLLNSQFVGNQLDASNVAHGGGLNLDASGSVVTIDQLLADGNRAGGVGSRGAGGGMELIMKGGTLNLSHATFSNNLAGGTDSGVRYGGGAYLYFGGGMQANIVDSTFSGNTAVEQGGGMVAKAYLGTTVTFQRTTISGNTAGKMGGGFYGYAYDPNTVVRFVDSTISGNTSDEGGGGLALVITDPNANFELTNSTVTQNRSDADMNNDYGGGGVYLDNSNLGPLVVSGSVIAGNSDGSMNAFNDIEQKTVGLQVYDSLIGDNAGTVFAEAQAPDADNNLIGSAGGGGIIDPQLRALADNGGFTQTHMPMPGSPLIDHYDGCSGDDQRGVPRGVDADAVPGNDCDIGAAEKLASDDAIFADGFEQPPILLTFSKRSAELSRDSILPLLSTRHRGQPVTVARATSPGVDAFAVIKARHGTDGVELQIQRFDGHDWIIGRWQPLTADSVELRW